MERNKLRSLLDGYFASLNKLGRYTDSFANEINNLYEASLKNRSLLVNGQVQSGKTAFLIGTICKFLDEGYDFVILLGGTNTQLLNQSFERLFKEIEVSNELHIIGDSSELGDIVLSEIKGKTIFSIMKEKANLSKLIYFLRRNKAAGKRILIVDDEADFGSINNGSESKLSSRIHQEIEEIFTNKLNECRYIAITATPFANILADSKDSLYPKAMLNMLPNTSYTGNTFFLHSNVYEPFDYGALEFVKNDDDEIENVLTRFLIEASLRELNGISKSQLLLNIDVMTVVQEELKSKVKEALENIFRNRKSLFKTKASSLAMDSDPEKLYKLIVKNTSELINDDSLIKINNGKNKPTINKEPIEIIIGGVLLSRGVTYENLAVEVLLNTPKENIAIDTLLQKARWFGYRRDVYNFMKIFIPPEAITAFKLYESVLKILLNDKQYGVILYANDIKSIKDNLIRFEKENKDKIILSNKKNKSGI